MIPSNKNFIKSIFSYDGNFYLKSTDIPSNASLIILDIATATRGIMIEASLLRNMFSNHTSYEIPYSELSNGTATANSYVIEYKTTDGVPSIRFTGGAFNIYFFE